MWMRNLNRVVEQMTLAELEHELEILGPLIRDMVAEKKRRKYWIRKEIQLRRKKLQNQPES